MSIQIKLPDPQEFPRLLPDDVLVNACIKKKQIETDRELYLTKWWDYRFMTPCEATFAFVDAFGIESRKIYARDIDYERAEHITVATAEKLREKLYENGSQAKLAFSSYWRARQVADAIGMPYDEYIREALNSRMRAWQRTVMPKPGHIYSERDVERVIDRWGQLTQSRIYYAGHYAYLAQNFVRAPAQVAYGAYLIERAGRTTDQVETLKDMINDDRLSVEFLRENIDRGVYDRVMNSLTH